MAEFHWLSHGLTNSPVSLLESYHDLIKVNLLLLLLFTSSSSTMTHSHTPFLVTPTVV